MKGADEYYDLFNGESQQIGRLFLQMSTHARGKCFEIFLLPEGVEITGNRIRGEYVEVYGMTGGQRGWTETYGWLHKGKWQEDFAKIAEEKKALKEADRVEAVRKAAEAKASRESEINKLLSTY